MLNNSGQKIMKHKVLSICILAVLLAGCKEDFSVWKKYNEDWLENVNKPYIESLRDAPVKEGYISAGITESGIQYIIRHEGFGKTAKLSSLVTVTYVNHLINGTTVGTVSKKTTIEVKKFSAGWQEMLCDRGLKEGANFTIYIPWHLAFGKAGQKQAGISKYFIPPYSAIRCDMIVHEIRNFPPDAK